MNDDVGIWLCGIDCDVFSFDWCDFDWWWLLGIVDGDFVVVFFGWIVLEKGIDVFGDVIVELKWCGVVYKVLVIGDGFVCDSFVE